MNNLISKPMADSSLPVMEIFQTLQGEGYHTGKAAVFIRLAGCDIGCNWCDIKESWNAHNWPRKSLDEIMAEVESFGISSVIISGGEPLVNNLDSLCAELKVKGMATFLETAGCYPLTGQWDWICLSPKKQTPPLKANLLLADELKVIVETPEDLAWAERNAKSVSEKCLLYLQPEWSNRKRIIPEITAYILRNPNWMLSLQSHKYIGIP
jgi:7-carboxy-7-deazaguanine synthase